MENVVAVVPHGRKLAVARKKKSGLLCATLTFTTRHGDVRLTACVPPALADNIYDGLMIARAELAKAVYALAMDGANAAHHGLPAVPVPSFLSQAEAATALELAARAADDDDDAIKKIRVISGDAGGRAAMQWAARAHLETRSSITGEDATAGDYIAGDYIGAGLPKIGASAAKKAQLALRLQGDAGRETKADYVRKILLFGAKGQADYDARHV